MASYNSDSEESFETDDYENEYFQEEDIEPRKRYVSIQEEIIEPPRRSGSIKPFFSTPTVNPTPCSTVSQPVPELEAIDLDNTVNVEYKKGPERTGASGVWRYFDKHGVDKAKCKNCSDILQNKCGSTSGLSRHLQKHPCEWKQYKELVLAKKTESQQNAAKRLKICSENNSTNSKQLSLSEAIEKNNVFPSNHPRAKKITRKIGELFGMDFQPFSIVDNKGFAQLLHVLEPRYKLPSRSTFSREIVPAIFEEVREKILRTIKNGIEDGIMSIAFTTDCWTSAVQESYMAVTCHFVDKNMDLQHFVLCNKNITTSHTAQNIYQHLLTVLEEWDIPSNSEEFPIFFVTDNARNIKAAIDISPWIWLSCFNHTLQLAIGDAMKQNNVFSDLCRKARAIVGHYKRSSKASQNLKKIQLQLGKPVHSLIQDVATRWNSEYYMLKRLVEQKEAISAELVNTEGIETLATNEWMLAEDLITVLEPLEETTRTFSGECYPTLSLAIPMLFGIEKAIDRHVKEKSRCQDFAVNLKESVTYRFPDFLHKNDLVLAMVLDPRFKHALILSGSEKTDVVSVLKDAVRKLGTDGQSTLPGTITQKSKSILWAEVDKVLAESTVVGTEEVDLYLIEPIINRSESALFWWKNHKSKYPKLSKLARKFLAIPATEVSSERVFSTGGNIVTKRRQKLKPENVEKLTFLHHNL